MKVIPLFFVMNLFFIPYFYGMDNNPDKRTAYLSKCTMNGVAVYAAGKLTLDLNYNIVLSNGRTLNLKQDNDSFQNGNLENNDKKNDE